MRLLVTALVLLLTSLSYALDSNVYGGHGLQSCDNWLPMFEQYGDSAEFHAADERGVDYALTLSWLAGFLSSANTYSDENVTVEQLLDYQIVVARHCEAKPSQSVFEAAYEAYNELALK